MGYTVRLENEKGELVSLDCQVVEIGSQGDMLHPFDAEMVITFNLRTHFKSVFPGGLHDLYGKKANDCINALAAAVLMLKDDFDGNPWSTNEGNARYYLESLLNWAREKPDAIFKVY